MQDRPYSDLFELIEALSGVQFAPIEQPRIKALVNSRAQRAYDATPWWPRWVKIGEERVVSGSLIPFEESGESTIGEFLRVFVSAPYLGNSSQEYDYSVTSDGCLLVATGLEPTSAFVTYRIAFDVTYGDGSGGEETNIPREWFQYLAHGVYSDFMRSDGQQEKAVIADQEAEEKLFFELTKPEITRTAQLAGNKVSTNMARQARTGYYAYPATSP